jgi:predicted ATPase
MWQGWSLVVQGQAKEGIAQLLQYIAAFQQQNIYLLRRSVLGLLAEAYGRAGQAEDGLTILDEALGLVHRNGERHGEAELYRLKGELLLALPASHQAEAEACFRQAIAIARGQSAKSWELRAVLSLSRLCHQQGKTEEARPMLSEIYGWFTEGFDTADLQEAKALLDVISQFHPTGQRGVPLPIAATAAWYRVKNEFCTEASSARRSVRWLRDRVPSPSANRSPISSSGAATFSTTRTTAAPPPAAGH